MEKQTIDIAFCVTTDLNFDQRMQRISGEVSKNWQVQLIGRNKKSSPSLIERTFTQHRFTLPFEKGKLFYICHNIWLFFYLFRITPKIVCACDLDTIPGALLYCKMTKTPMVYDAHEYFSRLPEIIHRPMIQKIWAKIEALAIQHSIDRYTVSWSYANLYEQQYGKPFGTIRNATVLEEINATIDVKSDEERIILYQGAVNVGRGIEAMIEAMQFINAKMVICGKGDIEDDCKNLVQKLELSHKVEFAGYVQPLELKQYTQKAWLGFTLFENDGESYYYSLANRFFDYMHHHVPQLASNFPEYKMINDEFEICVLISEITPQILSQRINELIDNDAMYQRLKNNCAAARTKYNWQEEGNKLTETYQRLMHDLA